MDDNADSNVRYKPDDLHIGHFVKFKDAEVKYWALVLEKHKRKISCEIFHVKPKDCDEYYKGKPVKIAYSSVKGVDDAWTVDMEQLQAFHKPTQLIFPMAAEDDGFVVLEPKHEKYNQVNWSMVGKNPKDAKRKIKSIETYLVEHLLQPLARYYRKKRMDDDV